MILPMARVRVIGPREQLDDALRALQDFGRVHLTESVTAAGVSPYPLTLHEARRARQLRRVLEDVERALQLLPVPSAPGTASAEGPATPSTIARWARDARRVRRHLEECARRENALGEEHALLLKYRDILEALRPLLVRVSSGARVALHAAVVPAAERATVEQLVRVLEQPELGAGAVVAMSRPLGDGDLALLLVMPASMERRIERLLVDARVPELVLPAAWAGGGLADAVPAMLERLGAIPGERDAIERERREVARTSGPALAASQRALHDLLSTHEARARCGVTRRLFAIEGWVPEQSFDALVRQENAALGPSVVVEQLARDRPGWDDAPVVLRNPRLFRPFESIVSMMPLPHYGSLDPTPFVAVFFPMFFGLMMGDVGYGLVLLAVGVLLRRRSPVDAPLHAAGSIAIACALFAILFGVAFGELFGDLGRQWLGLRPAAFDRERAVFAFLAVSVALGLMHILLGLVLGAFTNWRRERRHAIGSGLSALMLALVAGALLAAFEVLPRQLFQPAVVILIIAFPVLVAVEGIVAPIELLSTVGNVLSYARLMALGSASVMLAIVANSMVGAMGSAVVGVVFALLFHLVNFAIGLFSPTIHALRLHYVEFFGKFYAPGGSGYTPYAHWHAP